MQNFDYRCPNCNEPVTGSIDLLTVSDKTIEEARTKKTEECQHCHSIVFFAIAPEVEFFGEVAYYKDEL